MPDRPDRPFEALAEALCRANYGQALSDASATRTRECRAGAVALKVTLADSDLALVPLSGPAWEAMVERAYVAQWESAKSAAGVVYWADRRDVAAGLKAALAGEK